MFQMTVAPGGFVQPCRLLWGISRVYVFFFIPYTWGVTFAIIRVITAMFLKETLAVAAQDQENAVMEREKKKKRDVEHLRVIFEEADMDGNYAVTEDEFRVLLESPKIRHWLGVLELEVRDVHSLFKLLDTSGAG